MGIKGYKAFDKGLECRGFQYKENEIFEMKGQPRICDKGFHFCENPLDVLNHYDLTESEFAEVEALGDIDKEEEYEKDSKISTNKIKIGAKIGLNGLIKASFDFIWNKVKVEKINKDDKSVIAEDGDYSQVATSGYSSQVATSGYSSKVATSGDYSKVATSGYSSKVATSGYSSKVATSGDSSKVATSGDYSKVATSGDSSQVAINGKFSIGANIGICGKAKGIKGTWIVLAEYARNKDGYLYPKYVKSKKVDGKKIKENTYYQLIDGKFTEVEE